MFGLKNLFGPKTDFRKLVAEGAIVLDVRSPQEFASGHIPGATNIALERLQGSIASLKKQGKTIITCCRSGMRSSMAANMLKSAGIEAINGGPWTSLYKNLNK
jgi:rhodanese-related sulfurtransferase